MSILIFSKSDLPVIYGVSDFGASAPMDPGTDLALVAGSHHIGALADRARTIDFVLRAGLDNA